MHEKISNSKVDVGRDQSGAEAKPPNNLICRQRPLSGLSTGFSLKSGVYNLFLDCRQPYRQSY